MSFSTQKIVCIFVLCYRLGLVDASCCEDGWISFNESCYFFGHDDLEYQEAEKFCTHYGAHLTAIETSSENTFLKSQLGNLKDPKHWIGLTDESVEGDWTWYSSDNNVTFTDWGVGEPNQGRSANCVAMWASYKYQWVDEACTHLFKPLCEKTTNV